VLAEAPDGSYAVFSDFDGDGVIEQGERLDFPAGDQRARTADFVVPGWRYRTYPVTFARPGELPTRGPATTKLPSSRVITVSSEVVVRGSVSVNDREVLFYLGLDPHTGHPTATEGRQYMDTDGNGAIDTDYRSPETVWARGSAAMFRIDAAYLSLASVDLERGRGIFRSHSAKEYARFELTPGLILPDFAFVDFDGRARRLNDYRGKVVLLDFWGTWCGPCVAQIPFLKDAYEQFREQGFEIIGMNSEHPNATAADLTAGVVKARHFVAERGVRWTQAREASIKDLTARSFRVETWPTTVLIDRNGRIVSADRVELGQPGLRGETLAKTLAAVLK
jgi:thiol-disulfide isomerase/thioredoxin